MKTVPIKFNSTTEAVTYFAGLGFNECDSYKLASSLWTQDWAANKIEEQAKARNELRAEFPGLFKAADKFTAQGSDLSNQETDFTGTDMDYQQQRAE